MGALDAINGRFGQGAVQPGAVGRAPAWAMRRANLSSYYSTRVDDLLKVTAC